jgi:hypothetical protein
MVFCSFLFVSSFLYLIQIHISEPISTELCTRLPLRLEEVVEYVWTHHIWPFSTFSTSSVRSQCRILCTTWLPGQESLRQRFIRDLAGDTCTKCHPWCSRRQLRQESSATALYPWCSRRHLRVEVCCAVGNSYTTWKSERNASVQIFKPNGTGRKWILNYNCNCIWFQREYF